MKTHTHKSPEKQSSTGSESTSEATAGGKSAFSDERSTSVAQRKLRAGMAQSPRDAGTVQLQAAMQSPPAANSPISPPKANRTGLPDRLKSGIEQLSGLAMDDVKVHYNSSKPAQLRAHAYAQGTDIHVGPGQEQHLAHEAWHVVQQKQGRVAPTRQLKGKVEVNDDAGLEREADVMGAKALNRGGNEMAGLSPVPRRAEAPVVQCDFWDDYADETNDGLGFEIEREVQLFVEKLEELLVASQGEDEDRRIFRLVEVEELLAGATQNIRNGVLAFAYGNEADAGPIEQMVIAKLKQKFGYDIVEEFKRRFLGPLGFNGMNFRTKGLHYEYFKKNPRNNAVRTGMLGKYGGHPEAEGWLKDVIETASDVPRQIQVPVGGKYYKLMPPGSNFMTSYSVYYISWDELQIILGQQNLADNLGLPVSSYSAVYCVYEIEATQATTVYQSTVAPTEQVARRHNLRGKNQGGRTQTLILDSNTGPWRKNPVPVYFLDPDEVELMALSRFIDVN
ncbi:MAG: DUF4157 domain-containing protein [Bacteroidota bacterium]